MAAGNAMHVGRPSAGAPLATPARFAASPSSIAPEGLHAKNTTSGGAGVSPSGAYTMIFGVFARRGICGTSSGFTYPRSNINLQSFLGLFFTLRGKRNVVRVSSYRAVKMIFRHGVKYAPGRRQSPKTAARRLAAIEFFNARGRGIEKRHRHGPSRQVHCRARSFFHFHPVCASGHARSPEVVSRICCVRNARIARPALDSGFAPVEKPYFMRFFTPCAQKMSFFQGFFLVSTCVPSLRSL